MVVTCHVARSPAATGTGLPVTSESLPRLSSPVGEYGFGSLVLQGVFEASLAEPGAEEDLLGDPAVSRV